MVTRKKSTTIEEHIAAMEDAKRRLDSAGQTYQALYQYACDVLDNGTDLVEMYQTEKIRSVQLQAMLTRTEWR